MLVEQAAGVDHAEVPSPVGASETADAGVRGRRFRVDRRRGWDSRVDAWDDVSTSAGFTELRERILRIASPTLEDRVLDLGAGTGLLALALAPRVRTVEAVDASSGMLRRLSEHARAGGHANIRTVEADLRTLPLPDCAFTLVVSNYAFHHLDHAGKALALGEARRVLVPGGRLVIADMMFTLSLRPRDRQIVARKVIAIARRGPAGAARLAHNAGRVALRRWEHPESIEAWASLLAQRHFQDVTTLELNHEGGIATARRPALLA